MPASGPGVFAVRMMGRVVVRIVTGRLCRGARVARRWRVGRERLCGRVGSDCGWKVAVERCEVPSCVHDEVAGWLSSCILKRKQMLSRLHPCRQRLSDINW